MNRIITAALAVTAGLITAPTAHADPPPQGCHRDAILGLNPQVRYICDLSIQADGSWERWRWFVHPEYVTSQCIGVYEGFRDCPQWSKKVWPYSQTPVDKYRVTADTIPDGEPGHID